MTTNPSLAVLNDDRENHKLLKKLPRWAVLRWGRVRRAWKDRTGSYPPFGEFVDFLTKEADIVCDPVISMEALSNDGGRQKPGVKPARALATQGQEGTSGEWKVTSLIRVKASSVSCVTT